MAKTLKQIAQERRERESTERNLNERMAAMAERNKQIHGGAHSATEQASANAGIQSEAQRKVNEEIAKVVAAKEVEQARQAGSSSERKP